MRTDSRLTRATILAAAALLLTSTGCTTGTLAGDWRMVKASPSREVFAMDGMTFARDGSFAGTVTIDGRTAQEQGRFFFNGYKLILRPSGGGQREYNATLQMKRLKVIDQQKRHVVLQRT